MAANMMETLKQIQRDLADQKTYMRNLHVINKDLTEKLNSIEEKVSDLPQVLATIGKLEQQVKNNNMLLFGNDGTENHIKDRALVPYKTDPEDKNTDQLVEPPEKCMENTEATPLHNSYKVPLREEAEKNSKDTKNDDSFQRADQYKDDVRGLTNEIKEVKKMIKKFMEIRNTSVKETATCCKNDAAAISPTHLNADQINKLDDEFNNITHVYQSDMREIKELIKESIALNKKSIEESLQPLLKQETVKLPSIYFSAEQINQLNADLKQITHTTQSETREIKELIKNSVAAYKLSIQEATELRDTVLRENNQSAIREIKELIKASAKSIPVEGAAVCEQKTVQISPTYFSVDQLSKLNSELKRIAEMYQETNIYPIVEVVPGAGDEHPVMKQLRKGVFYEGKVTLSHSKIKLGLNGLKRCDVIDMITDYPDLTVNDVVREWMVDNKKWNEWIKKYDFGTQIFVNGEFEYLPVQH